MKSEEYEVSYGISINGSKPTARFDKYPSDELLESWTTPQMESVEVIERDISYFKVAKHK